MNYRNGEIDKFLAMKEKFKNLLYIYSDGVVFDIEVPDYTSKFLEIIYYLGICNYRNYYPRISEVKAICSISDSEFEKFLNLLEQWGVIVSMHGFDLTDEKMMMITETFWSEFNGFMIDSIKIRETQHLKSA